VTTHIDETHRADLVSWVESAQEADTDFPIQNLPVGVFRSIERWARPGVPIGDQVLDLVAVAERGLFPEAIGAMMRRCKEESSLNPLLAQGRAALRALRAAVNVVLRADTAEGARARRRSSGLLVPIASAEPLLPVQVGDYTDFYASIHHATNVGTMLRPDNPLLPNYKWVPIGYHGRASSIVPTGSAVRRPVGQSKDESADAPSVGPSRRLDYELEVGAVIAGGNALGQSIALGDAESHVAALCLVNDWSARDIQTWEYQPLGPFLAKNFGTTMSPWLVTLDALAPFRAPAFRRAEGDPAPLPYLYDAENERAGGFDITLEVCITSERMRAERIAPMRVSLANFTSMYWTVAQLLTHHTSNGCNMRPGDLFASGTVSGETKDSRGCMLERTWRGTEPLALPTGETRRFLEDGDEIVMRGWCEREGFRRIGFGDCRGIVAPA
jgi:fumarylacetoacetase